ncbi:hypothetical protein [Paludisphaera borealis]|uniref:Uncharacterized protein n=1 Tax=Paludisphaera borealis TaxID=1387353 RepID=A0A1U7CU10_9BACT|nr:hypothetical protein [Paludisphaera borealis]APW62398.1 hypothetical protein BSF38_03937 [Paludisphaera borealis]
MLDDDRRREFARVVGRREDEINAWLDSLGNSRDWPEAGDQFMYLVKASTEAACEFHEEE